MERRSAVSQYTTHLETAYGFYAEGNYEAAKAASEHAISCALATDGKEACALRALCLRKLEFNDEAFDALKEIVETAPTAETCAEFALMRAERNDCGDGCRNLAQSAIDADPDLPSAYIALFRCDVSDNAPLSAVKNLRRGILRGSDFPEKHAFDIIRNWCQRYCDEGQPQSAYAIIREIGDLFTSFDFVILQARIADICNDHRVAVHYYKKALAWLRPGQMRSEILEEIAKIAI